MTEQQKKVLVRAITVFGYKEQLRILQEECAELSVAVSKVCRYGWKSEENLASLFHECADVLVMIEQVRLMDPEGSQEIDRVFNEKIERLERLLPPVTPMMISIPGETLEVK